MNLLPFLPFAITLAFLLVAPAPLPSALRGSATKILLATLLFSFITSLLMIRINAHSDSITASRWISSSLAMLCAGCVAAPILDRARASGILIGSGLAGVFLVPLFLHGFVNHLPPVSGISFLYALVIAATLIGLRASKQLPVSTARFTPTGSRRIYPLATFRLTSGWLMLSGVLLLFAHVMTAPDTELALFPIVISGAAAVFVTLLHPHLRLHQTGEAFAAGIVIALGGAPSLELTLLSGALAGFIMLYSEAISQAFNLDDTANFMGVFLIPASLGLLGSGIHYANFTATATWFYAALGVGLSIAFLLWPCIKLTVGLAALSAAKAT